MPCKRDIIRGGTDGALMTALGLPTPNLSVGQFNIHSTREFVSVDCMEDAISHMIHLLSLWSEQRRES
jgi:tripeptide aminopeptidase